MTASSCRALAPVLVLVLGCAPTVNVGGTYFPPALVSAAIGLIGGYIFARVLARRPALRPLGQSALLFAGTAVVIGFVAWWSLFREF